MNRIVFTAGWCFAIVGARVSYAEDWPTYRHDNARSGHTSQTLAIDRLHEQWVWRSPQPPQTAWAGPAKWTRMVTATLCRRCAIMTEPSM